MITKAKHHEISKKWRGKIYEHWKRTEPRLRLFNTVVGLLKDKDILEIGSNAGIYGYEISKHSKSYVGIEESRHYYKQALRTKRFIDGDSEFINIKAIKFLKTNSRTFNAFVSFFVLYHLNNKEIDLLRKNIWSKCDVIINMVRIQNKPLKKNGYYLCKYNNIIKMLNAIGFVSEVYKNNNLYLVVSKNETSW